MNQLLSRIEPVLESTTTRLGLSFLIVLSVLPERTLAMLMPGALLDVLPLLLFGIFLPELVLRTLLLRRRRRMGQSASRAEGWLLAVDVVAVASFLPLHLISPGFANLRLLRLARLLLLFSYWGKTLQELWHILGDRERRGQVLLVVAIGALLAFGGAVLLGSIGIGFDFNDDGAIDANDRSFVRILWWSLLQVQDPGNLVRHPDAPLVVAISLALTFAGLLLFSFLVGIGTSTVEELMVRSRTRAPGLSGHTAILCLGTNADRLVTELGALYEKNHKPFRAAVLASEEPRVTLERSRRRVVARRRGDPLDPDDLTRVDLDYARRAVLVANADDADGPLFAGILAVRARQPSLPLFAVIEHERDFSAARHAGGAATTVIGASSFLGHVLTRSVVDPGASTLIDELLTAAGCEVYTYLFDADERVVLGQRPPIRLRELRAAAHARANVTLLGVFRAPLGCEQEKLADDELDVILDPASDAQVEAGGLRGLVAIAPGFGDIRDFGRDLVAGLALAPVAAGEGTQVSLRRLAGPRRILVCGGSPRLPRMIRLLAEDLLASEAASTTASEPLILDVVVRDQSRVAKLRSEVLAALAGHLPGVPGEAPLTTNTEPGPAETLAIHAPGPAGTSGQAIGAKVRFHVLDWTDPVRLLDDGKGPLATAEVVLLAPGPDEVATPDGQVALDALRLAELGRHTGFTRSDLRGVVVIADPSRADLLADRLGRDGDRRFVVLCSERIRDRYIVQGLFVRGLTRVMLELLGSGATRLERLEIDGGADGLSASLAHHQATLVAAELHGGELVVEPRRLRSLNHTSPVVAVYAITSAALRYPAA